MKTLRKYSAKVADMPDLTKTEIKAIVKHLKALASGKVKPVKSYHGLCSELCNKYNTLAFDLNAYWVDWPKYSGNPAYPVGKGEVDYRSIDCSMRNLWDRRTKIGKLRCELCLFLAAELTKQVKEGVYK